MRGVDGGAGVSVILKGENSHFTIEIKLMRILIMNYIWHNNMVRQH